MRNFLRKVAGDRGTAAIEFAIVLPVLVLFAFGLIDLGRAVWTQSTLDYAAQATARCAAISGSLCTGSNTAQSYGQTQSYGLSDVAVTMNLTPAGCQTPPSSCSGQRAFVTATFTYFMPLLSHFSGTFCASACYPT